MSWKNRDLAKLADQVSAAGFRVDHRLRKAIDEALAGANLAREVGVLAREEVLQTMLAASRSPDEYAFRMAPSGQPRTACLVARAGYQRWIVGVTTCGSGPADCVGWGLQRWGSGRDLKLLATWTAKFDETKIGIVFEPPLEKRTEVEDDARHEARLLAQIIAAPDDDGPRLVYADWIAARDPLRAELIVIQCQVESMAVGAKRRALERRAIEMLSAHGKHWHPPYSFSYRRGFAFAVEGIGSALIELLPKLFATMPLQQVRITPTHDELATLLTRAELHRLDSLALDCHRLETQRALEQLAACGHLAGLGHLLLHGASFTDASAALLANPTTLPGLRRLTLEVCQLSARNRAVCARREALTIARR